MNKITLVLETVGRNPMDWRKNGSKRNILIDGRSIPLSLLASGARTHDMKLLEATLDNINKNDQKFEEDNICVHPMEIWENKE